MATRKLEEKNRKLARIGKQPIGLTLPIELVREFDWKKTESGGEKIRTSSNRSPCARNELHKKTWSFQPGLFR